MQNIRSLLSITMASTILLVGASAQAAPCPFSGSYQYNPASPTTNRCPAFTYISTQQSPGPGNSCTPIFVCQNPQTGVNCEQTMNPPTLSCAGGTNSGCRTCVYDAMCASTWSNTMAGVSCGAPAVCNGSGACAACTSTNDPVCNDNNPCTTDTCSNPNTATAACTRVNLSAGTVCRAANGVCDRQETCPGAGANCPADTYQPSTTVCRAGSNTCDPAESCTGSSTTCPADVLSAAGTVCRASAGGCDLQEVCAGGGAACPADSFRPNTFVCRAAVNATCDIAESCPGNSAACPVDAFQPSTTQCRASAGACDVAENCSAGSCPADSFISSGTTCRASATGDACDPQEVCPGNSAACPANTFAAASTVCRAAAGGGCDVQEVCAGGGAACPANSFQPSSFVCRAAADATCDTAETCPGNSATCPANTVAPSTTVCRASAGACDVAENCSGGVCPANAFLNTVCRASATGDLCDPAEICTGAAATCPANVVATAGTVCRATAAGGCDVQEVCAGGGVACPANAFQPSTFVCRAAANATCDIAESCPGNSATCPVDTVAPTTTVCRAATAGGCDLAENCSGGLCPTDTFRASGFVCRASATGDLCDPQEVCPGGSATCPTNTLATAGATCRASAGGCDILETCAGGGVACPSDTFRASGFVCRAAADATCDIAETCAGNTSACPADTVAPTTTVCRVSAAGGCDVAENCAAGVCPADALRASGFVCRVSATGDLCDPQEVCPGNSVNCPANAVAAVNTACRASAGGCDVQEVCAGGGVACPSDTLRASGYVCRAAATTCDVAETCNGSTTSCPSNALAAVGTSCGPSSRCCLGTATACTGGALTCSTGCRNNSDCTSPQYCTAGFVCATPACVTAADCTEGGVDNPCTVNTCSGTAASATCVYTPQALSTRTCVRGASPFAPGTPNGYCQLSSGSPVCVECLSDSDCSSPNFCTNNVCTPPACLTNADCNEGGTDNVCTTNACVGVGAAAACQYTPIMSNSMSAMNCRRGAAPFSGTPDGFCINNAGAPACVQCLDSGDCGTSGQCCSAAACVTCQACLSTSTTQSGTGGLCGNPPGAAGGNADSIFRYIPAGQASNDALQIGYQLRAADVNFLLDTTLSMGGELSNLQSALTAGTIAQTCNSACTTATQGIMGAIRCCVSGAYFGVGTFDDYQVDPHGAPWNRRITTYGTSTVSDTTSSPPFSDDGDRVYWNRSAITDPAGTAATRYTFVPRGVASGVPSSANYGNTLSGSVTGQVHLSQIVNGLSLGQGGDIPEAQLMALNLLTVSDTTNNGVYNSAAMGDSTEYVVPAYARRTGSGTTICDTTNYWGYPCFRQGSIPVTVMMTDAPFHNGIQLPSGDAMATLFPVLGANYTTSGILYPNTLGSAAGPLYPPPSWTTVVSNLLSREMRIITVESSDGRSCTSNNDCNSTPPGCLAFVAGYESKCISNVCRGPAYAHARALANATGSLDGYGAPYVNSISCQGTGMGTSIVTQVAQLAQQERMDIWMDSVGAPAGMDVTFIPTTMSPVGGCQPITGSTFPQCLPGTQTNFTVRIRNNTLSPPTPTEYNFTVRLRGGSTRILKQVPVRIMVGPGQATYPAMGSYTQMFSQFTGESCTTDADCTVAGSGRFCVATATGTRQCSRCGTGERPAWGRFTWSSVLPFGTRINFTIRTADTAAATATTTAVWTSDSVCPMGQTCISATSDIDNDTHPDALGGAFDLTRRLTTAGLAAGRRYLQVTVGMYSSPTMNATPELGALGLEMNCLAAE